MTDTPTALKPETVERLNKLFNEVTDMNVALGHLIRSDDRNSCQAALEHLQHAIDVRLAEVWELWPEFKEAVKGQAAQIVPDRGRTA